MVTLAAIIPSLDQEDSGLALDIQDTYFLIRLHLSHKQFLHFTVGQDHFQYQVLPFNLSSLLMVFSKVMSVVAAAELHRKVFKCSLTWTICC